jgi:hypothetical protein
MRNTASYTLLRPRLRLPARADADSPVPNEVHLLALYQLYCAYKVRIRLRTNMFMM